MYIPVITTTVALLISLLVFSIAKVLRARSNNDREKTSPFECGFDPKNNARIPFSLRFFMLAIIFIVFDIEIVLLIPIPIINTMIDTVQAEIAGVVFLVILLLGLFHE